MLHLSLSTSDGNRWKRNRVFSVMTQMPRKGCGFRLRHPPETAVFVRFLHEVVRDIDSASDWRPAPDSNASELHRVWKVVRIDATCCGTPLAATPHSSKVGHCKPIGRLPEQKGQLDLNSVTICCTKRYGVIAPPSFQLADSIEFGATGFELQRTNSDI